MTDLRTAAQQALEALEKLVVGSEYEDAIEAERAITALRAALAEPVQAPVAWRTKNATPPVVFQQYPSAVVDLGGEIEPLYTAPPQRKPLTEEEIAKILSTPLSVAGVSAYAFARAIEQAHGIGND